MNNNNNKIFKVGLTITINLVLLQNIFATDLLSVYKLAEKNDPQIKQAIAEYKAVEHNVPISVAELLPSVILSAGMSYDKVLNLTGRPEIRKKYFSVDFTQSIFQWDKIQKYLQSELEVKQAIHNLEVAKEDLLIRVSDAYFNILEAEDKLEFISTEKTSVKQLYDEAKERFDVGLIAIADVEEAKAKYDIKTAEEIQAQNNLEDRYEELTEILGEKINNIDVLIPNFKPSSPKPKDINKWIKLAQDRNHQLISEQLESQIQEKNQDIAFAGHLPSVILTANYGGTESNKSIQVNDVRAVKGYTANYGAELRGELELFASGGTQATIDQAGYNAKAASYNTERVRRETVSNTVQSYRTIMSNISQIAALEQAEKSSLSSLEATKAGYDIGTRASIDVLDRLTDLYEQKQKLSSTRYEYIKNVINLKRNSGILTNDDIAIVNKWLVNRKIKKSHLDKFDIKDDIIQDIKDKNNQTIESKEKNQLKEIKQVIEGTKEVKTQDKVDTEQKSKILKELDQKLEQIKNNKTTEVKEEIKESLTKTKEPEDKSKDLNSENSSKDIKELLTTPDDNQIKNTTSPKNIESENIKNTENKSEIKSDVKLDSDSTLEQKSERNTETKIEPKDNSKDNLKDNSEKTLDHDASSDSLSVPLDELEKQLQEIIKQYNNE